MIRGQLSAIIFLIIWIYGIRNWQTFGRLRLRFIQSAQCLVTSQAALVSIQRVRKDYAQSEVTQGWPRHGRGLGFKSPRAYHFY